MGETAERFSNTSVGTAILVDAGLTVTRKAAENDSRI